METGRKFCLPNGYYISFKKMKMICNVDFHHLQRLTNFKITRFITHINWFKVGNKKSGDGNGHFGDLA